MVLIEGIHLKDDSGWKEVEEVFVDRISEENGIPKDYSFITSAGNKKKIHDKDKGFCHKKFNANFIIDGLSLEKINFNSKISLGEAEMEITEVGKKCHKNCPVFSVNEPCTLGSYIFFGRVIKEGIIRKNDIVTLK